jgi:hypothetical protein
MSIRFRVCIVLPFSFVVTLTGCGGSGGAPIENLVPASGTVKLDGKPAEGVRIRLVPANDTTKSVGGAWAVTEEDGTFTVMHWTKKEGIAPGSYVITFSKLVKPDGSPLDDSESPAMVQAKESIAPKWSAPDADKMTAMARRVDIPDAGKSDIDFSISSAKN